MLIGGLPVWWGPHVSWDGAWEGRGFLYGEVTMWVEGSLYIEIQLVVTWDPPVNRMTDTDDAWKHYLPATSLEDGNEAFP